MLQYTRSSYCDNNAYLSSSCVDPESFVRGGPDFFYYFFLVDERIEDPNTTINGPSSARHQNAIKMALSWYADVGPTLNAGLVAL